MFRTISKYWPVLFTISALFSFALHAAPKQVILIRHAEEPSYGMHLSPKGKQRAQALVGFLKNDPRVNHQGVPIAMYAAKQKGEDGSVRSYETIEPSSKAFKVAINDGYKKGDVEDLVYEIMHARRYNGGTVVICWKHSAIPDLVTEFGWEDGPEEWKEAVYDRAWVLDFSGDEVINFRNLAQKLLPGDSTR